MAQSQPDLAQQDRANEWAALLDSLIVGIAHSISNRVAALAGISDLLAMSPSVSPATRALADEVPKLEEALRLLRLLALPNEPEEGVEPIGVIRDAIALARLHPELKGVTYTLDGESAVPVLARPIALTHSVLHTLTQAAQQRTDGEVLVRLDVEGDELLITVGTRSLRVPTLVAARARRA